MRREKNVLALVKGQERYVFVYDDDCGDDVIDVFRQYAADPTLAFSWFDAAVLSDKAREQLAQTTSKTTDRCTSRMSGR